MKKICSFHKETKSYLHYTFKLKCEILGKKHTAVSMRYEEQLIQASTLRTSTLNSYSYS